MIKTFAVINNKDGVGQTPSPVGKGANARHIEKTISVQSEPRG